MEGQAANVPIHQTGGLMGVAVASGGGRVEVAYAKARQILPISAQIKTTETYTKLQTLVKPGQK